MNVKKITHKGQVVVYADYRNQSVPEQIETLAEVAKVLKESPVSLALVSNFEGASVGPDYMNKAKEFGVTYKDKIKIQALTGITGLKKILLQAYNKFTGENAQSFDTEAEMLDWVTR